MSRRFGRLFLAVAVLGILGLPGPARAQDEDPPVAAPEEAQPAGPDDAMSDEQFEQWIFGKGAQNARKQFESWLGKQIDRADQTYRLSPGQKKKLDLAGRASLKRLFDRFETAREQLHRARGDLGRIGPDLQDLQSFQQAPHDYLFGENSLFAKTLRRTLTPTQLYARDQTAYRARVEWMASLLDKALGLTPDQHRRLASLIVEETPPLGRYGTFDYDAMMLQVSRLPPDRIRPILDEAQFRRLVDRFEQARRLESVLVGEGYVPATPPGPRSTAAGQGGSKQKVIGDRHGPGVLVGNGQARRD
jgi:hypothetical protein